MQKLQEVRLDARKTLLGAEGGIQLRDLSEDRWWMQHPTLSAVWCAMELLGLSASQNQSGPSILQGGTSWIHQEILPAHFSPCFQIAGFPLGFSPFLTPAPFQVTGFSTQLDPHKKRLHARPPEVDLPCLAGVAGFGAVPLPPRRGVPRPAARRPPHAGADSRMPPFGEFWERRSAGKVCGTSSPTPPPPSSPELWSLLG